MKKSIISLILVTTVASALIADNCQKSCDTDCSQSINLWQPRSFNAYSSRDIIHKKTFYNNDSHRDEYQGMLSTAFEFMQSFGGQCGTCKNLGARPFWSGTNTMSYGTNDGESDIDAYQFGMGGVIGQGEITLDPEIRHFGADIMLHFARNKHEKGLFFTLKAPLGAMSIETRLTEKVANLNGPIDSVNLGTSPVDTAWLTYPSQDARYQSLTEAWQAGTSSLDGSTNSSRHKLFVITLGRISDCKQTVIRLGDISATIGYKLHASDRGSFDLGLKLSCPTGNVPTGEFVLEPVFGRAGHWGLGLETGCNYNLWKDEVKERGVDLWMQGELLHLFNGRRSFRSFDLKKNGPGSKYMLLQYYFPVNPTTENPEGRLASFVTHAVNVTTMPVVSTFNIEGSLALAFDFYNENWNATIGGEVWGRSRECLSLDCCHLVQERAANLNDYAVLGRQISEDSRVTPDPFSIHLCEPEAKINKSQNRAEVNTTTPEVVSQPDGVVDARLSKNRIPTALTEALDIAGAASAKALTGKIFTQIGHTWNNYKYTPNLSLLGSVEFAPSNNNQAINLWSVGLQGSLNF